MAFKKGQWIVAIRTHSDGDFRKGEEFRVLDVKPAPCCGRSLVDIGRGNHKYNLCTACDHVYAKQGNCTYYENSFAPLQYRSVGISKELAKSFTETLETSEVITKKLTENA